MSFKEIAKEAGKAVARQTGIKRIGATTTDKLVKKTINSEISDAYRLTLTEMKEFMQAAKQVERLAKLSYFSHLEKLARKAKDDCKTLYPKVEAEGYSGDKLDEERKKYEIIRNHFLNKTHQATRRLYLVCEGIEELFKNALNVQSIDSQKDITKEQLNKLPSIIQKDLQTFLAKTSNIN
ncbi:MAG: hypothetical protein IJJ04_02905 [Clostridia bacterium]|nr:hypothetical protein [Clostridia bacterium]